MATFTDRAIVVQAICLQGAISFCAAQGFSADAGGWNGIAVDLWFLHVAASVVIGLIFVAGMWAWYRSGVDVLAVVRFRDAPAVSQDWQLVQRLIYLAFFYLCLAMNVLAYVVLSGSISHKETLEAFTTNRVLVAFGVILLAVTIDLAIVLKRRFFPKGRRGFSRIA